MGHHKTKTRCGIVHGIGSPILTTRALEIGYRQGRRAVVSLARELDLAVFPGEMVCLVGPNGVGKSTLLRTLIGLHPALAGEIWLEERPLEDFSNKELASRVSIVLTGSVQTGAMRVVELVGLGRFPYTGLFDRLSDFDNAVIQESLRQVGAEGLADCFLHELSDGEKQKVMIARALAQQPVLMVLDEPTAFLDLPNRVSVMHLLHGLAHARDKAVLTSTHDLDLALRTADRVWLMDKSGVITQGAPEDLVLRGTFGSTFTQSNVQFNPGTGSFESQQIPDRQVVLFAEGLNHIWTTRALQRAGFEVLTEGQTVDLIIAVSGKSKNTIWKLTRNGTTLEFDSIYALLIALNE